MELIKREHQYSREYRVFDALDRREIIEVIDNLDYNEIQEELMGRAYDESCGGDFSGRLVAELCVRTGKVYYSYTRNGQGALDPDLYVKLGSTSASPEAFWYKNEDILEDEALEEYKALTEDESSEYYNDKCEAFNIVVDKYINDLEEYVKGHFVEYYSDSVEIASRAEIINKVREIYNEESVVAEEIDKAEIIRGLDEDSFDSFWEECETKEELIEKVVDHIKESDPEFDFGADFNEEDFEDEDDYNEAIEDAEYKFVESRMDWEDSKEDEWGYYEEVCREYCIWNPHGFKDMCVLTVDRALNGELEQHDVLQVSLNANAVNNTVSFMQKWKDEEGYKYIYLVTHQNHVKTPHEYTVVAIVYSNIKIDNVFEYLKENENFEIGEFEILGCNHFVQECEDFDIEKIGQYKKFPQYDSYEEVKERVFYIQ